MAPDDSWERAMAALARVTRFGPDDAYDGDDDDDDDCAYCDFVCFFFPPLFQCCRMCLCYEQRVERYTSTS